MVSFNASFSGIDPALNFDVNKFSISANQMAREILATQKGSAPYVGPRVITRYHYWHEPFWSPSWMFCRPVYVYPSGNCSRRRDRDNDGTAFLIGMIATIVGGIALFAVGSGRNTFKEAKCELEDAAASRTKFSDYEQAAHNNTERNVALEAKNAAVLKVRICKRIRDSALKDLVFRVGLVAGCALALAGAIFTSPTLITAGLVTGLVVGGSMLFNWGLDSTDKQNINDANKLLEAMNNMRSV